MIFINSARFLFFGEQDTVLNVLGAVESGRKYHYFPMQLQRIFDWVFSMMTLSVPRCRTPVWLS